MHKLRALRLVSNSGVHRSRDHQWPKIILTMSPSGQSRFEKPEIVLQMLRQLNYKDLGQTIVMITPQPRSHHVFRPRVHAVRDGLSST